MRAREGREGVESAARAALCSCERFDRVKKAAIALAALAQRCNGVAKRGDQLRASAIGVGPRLGSYLYVAFRRCPRHLRSHRGASRWDREAAAVPSSFSPPGGPTSSRLRARSRLLRTCMQRVIGRFAALLIVDAGRPGAQAQTGARATRAGLGATECHAARLCVSRAQQDQRLVREEAAALGTRALMSPRHRRPRSEQERRCLLASLSVRCGSRRGRIATPGALRVA